MESGICDHFGVKGLKEPTNKRDDDDDVAVVCVLTLQMGPKTNNCIISREYTKSAPSQ